jgi:integrase
VGTVGPAGHRFRGGRGRSTSDMGYQSHVSALRSLLGFLHVTGRMPHPLVAAVPSVAGWGLGTLPRAVGGEHVAALLASCDRTSAMGRRDYAILLLLSRLGLRNGEVTRLRLGDIDWRAGQMVICGKGNRHELLPLPDDVGRAVVDYLIHGRPPGISSRAVFVIGRAPFTGRRGPPRHTGRTRQGPDHRILTGAGALKWTGKGGIRAKFNNDDVEYADNALTELVESAQVIRKEEGRTVWVELTR